MGAALNIFDIDVTPIKENIMKDSKLSNVIKEHVGRFGSNQSKSQYIDSIFNQGYLDVAANGGLRGVKINDIHFGDTTISGNFFRQALSYVFAEVVNQEIAPTEYGQFGILSLKQMPKTAKEIIRIATKVTGDMVVGTLGTNTNPTMNLGIEQIKTPIVEYSTAIEAKESDLDYFREYGLSFMANAAAGAFEIAELELDKMLFTGEPLLGTTGLLNNGVVTTEVEDTNIYSLIASKDADGIKAIFSKGIDLINNRETNNMIIPDTIIVHPELLKEMNRTRVTDIQKDATNVNLVSMLEEDLKVTFKSCRRLDKVTDDDKYERIVIARLGGLTASKSLISAFVGTPFTMEAPIRERQRQIVSDAYQSFSALNIADPKVIAYMDIKVAD